MRKLTKAASLDIIKRAGVPIETVIDIGVQYGTPDLMQAYPDKHHILVEAIAEYADRIEQEYSTIQHTLITCAATDADGNGHLNTISLREGEAITHAFLHDSGRAIQTGRVDTLVAESGVPGPYLLKIDVEGAEIPGRIVDGSSGIMARTNVVICEMVTSRFIDIANRIERHGFALWDIVDACYYDNTLWQTDAIFIRRSLLGNPVLAPMTNHGFDASKWWPSYA